MGVVMYMATYGLRNPRNYWREQHEPVTQHFTVGRFEQLHSSIHFNCRNSSCKSDDNSGEKIQPVIDFLNARLATLQLNKHLCIDEMMISSKSKFGPRVYQKGKPHSWGFKLFGISDMFGIVYKIHLHTGKFQKDDDFLDLGSKANRVF